MGQTRGMNPAGKISEKVGRSVALGILSWKSDVTLEHTLADHRDRGLFSLFDKSVIHFQEVRDVDRERADRYGVSYIASDHNRHIGGGFYHLVREVAADYFFLLEDDLTIAVDADELGDTLAGAIEIIEDGGMHRFHSRRDNMVRSGYEKYFPVVDFDAVSNPDVQGLRLDGSPFGKWVRRTCRPAQAEMQLSKIVWFEREPEKVRPDLITKTQRYGRDYYIMQGRGAKWANPGLLASRAHLLEAYDHVAAVTPGFLEFGKSLESLVNEGPFRAWWLSRNYKIGFTKPVLTVHDRHGDGGKLCLP